MENSKILSPGQRLKAIRKELKIKQEELAGDRFCKNYISLFENDKRKINAINATYIADKLNSLAKSKGIAFSISANYFLKNEKDMASDKCKGYLEEVKRIPDFCSPKTNMVLYKVLTLSDEYQLIDFKAQALYFKGINSLKNERFNCAVVQFLEAIIYFAKNDRFQHIANTYKYIGMTLYQQKLFKQAISPFKLAEVMALRCKDSCKETTDEIRFYKALCYFGLGDYKKAKEIIDEIDNKDDILVRLESKMNFRM